MQIGKPYAAEYAIIRFTVRTGTCVMLHEQANRKLAACVHTFVRACIPRRQRSHSFAEITCHIEM